MGLAAGAAGLALGLFGFAEDAGLRTVLLTAAAAGVGSASTALFVVLESTGTSGIAWDADLGKLALVGSAP